jgi:hypothetical protein
MDSVLRNYFLGKGFAKTETDVFEIRREFGLGFNAQEGSGRECAPGFYDLLCSYNKISYYYFAIMFKLSKDLIEARLREGNAGLYFRTETIGYEVRMIFHIILKKLLEES